MYEIYPDYPTDLKYQESLLVKETTARKDPRAPYALLHPRLQCIASTELTPEETLTLRACSTSRGSRYRTCGRGRFCDVLTRGFVNRRR